MRTHLERSGGSVGESMRSVACLALAALLLAGCTTQAVTRSGYLQGYDHLVSESDRTKSLTWRPERSVLAGYDALYVAPVEVHLTGEEGHAEMLEVASLATAALRRELGAEWTIVDRPTAARTLSVRTALTAVKTSNPALNVVLFILLPVPLDNGGLSAEAEFLDASTGQPVGAIAWAGQGLWDPVGYFSPYGHPRQLTEDLAKSVAALLKRSSGPEPGPAVPSKDPSVHRIE